MKQIKKTWLALKDAGAVADRDQLRELVSRELQNDLEMLAERKTAIKDDFRKRSERRETNA